MIARLKLHLLFGVVALLVAGIAYSQLPEKPADAAVTTMRYENFSYSTATQRATWDFVFIIDDTFNQDYLFNSIGPAGTLITAATPLTCGALPATPPRTCNHTFPPGGTTLRLTLSSPFPQTCAAQIVSIGAVNFNNTAINLPAPGTNYVHPASTQSLVGGVLVNNTVPANTTLCPVNTPIPNTPTPTTTPVPPAVLPVIPQVFQHVPQGIFNGSRNNTPTPVRPVGTAGSTGVGLPPSSGAMPVLRPQSTGDAGLLTLQKLSVW